LATVERAEAALAGCEVDDATRQRVGDGRRDLAFVALLDRIRQDLAGSSAGRAFNEEEQWKLLPQGWNFHAQTTLRPRILC
jgi:hypothetical protein